MTLEQTTNSIEQISHTISSGFLKRDVKIDIYRPGFLSGGEQPSLLLINDGQDLATMGWKTILEGFFARRGAIPLISVGIHAGEERRMEYGTIGVADYMGRGAKAGDYANFVLQELLPFIRMHSGFTEFREKLFAGFSLGGLSALSIAWAYPHEFVRVGVFSGSLWWRMIDQTDPEYKDEEHRIMHDLIRKGSYAPWLKFFLMTGTMDETNDRNGNGIIDSIDDTLDLMKELAKKGYDRERDMHYLELADGHHDVATWGRAMPVFLDWAFGEEGEGRRENGEW
jgi:enterochelin esterase-like enzyme